MITKYEPGTLSGFMLYWKKGNRSVILSYSYGAGSVGCNLTVRDSPTTPLIEKYIAEGKLVTPPRDIDAVFKQWQDLPDSLFRKKPVEK